MALNAAWLASALKRLAATMDDATQRKPLRTTEIPWFRDGGEPGSFEFSANTELDWGLIVNEAYAAARDTPEVEVATVHVADELPAAVRDADYLPVSGPVPTPARVFCAFAELAVRELANASATELEAPDEFPAALAALEAFCRADRHRLVHTAPLSGVSLGRDEIEISPSVALRTANDDDRQAFWRRLGAPPSTRIVLMHPSVNEVAAVEASVTVTRDLSPGTTEQPWRDLQDPIERTVDSLRLLGSGFVRWLGQWTDFPEHEAFLRRLFISGTQKPAPRWGTVPETARVKVDGPEPLSQIYQWRSAIDGWPEPQQHQYEIAHRRFSQTYDRTSDEDRLIDAWIAFEALFLPDQEGELNYRAQMRIARFVGDNLTERQQIRDQLRKSYGMRSAVVHGAKAKKRKPEDVKARASETIDILRRALRKWINPSTNRAPDALDDELLS